MGPIDFDRKQLSIFEAKINSFPMGMYDSLKNCFSLIPAGIKPLIIADEVWHLMQEDSRQIVSALEKVALWLTLDGQRNLAKSLYSDLGSIELLAAKDQSQFNAGLATARLDLFYDGESLQVIEANTTIPAMQAYSDMIRIAYFEALGKPLQDPKRSNSFDLLQSLLLHYQKNGGKNSKPSIAIVARPGDSQLAELLWLQHLWQNVLGYETCLLHPGDISLQDNRLWALNKPIDLVYRHIFAHRLEPKSSFYEACTQSRRFQIFNPVAAHLEAKGVFAELSRLTMVPSLCEAARLTAPEIYACQKRLVWSRILQPGSMRGPDGEKVAEMSSWVKARAKDIVVKSSLGYGGSGVFLGEEFSRVATQQRVQLLLGVAYEVSWADFVDFCLKQRLGTWIVQKRLQGKKSRNQFLVQGVLEEQDTYFDCSIFANSGVEGLAFGGASRFASTAIVNLGQRGGLAPLLLASEM